jgi:hypothetical protein
MAEIVGPATIVRRALPSGWDGTKIAEWEAIQGISWQEFMSRVALAIGTKNTELDNKWSWSYQLTEDIKMEYEDGGSVTPMELITDQDRVNIRHGSTIGHMLQLNPYGGAVGGTWRFFRDARLAQIVADIAVIVRTGEWRFEQTLLTRLLTNTENAIGSAGYDVPFVRGTGGQIDYTPLPYAGETFTTSHDHFLGIASGSKTRAQMIDEMAEHLEEHGHTGPYTMLISRADVANFTVLGKFVQFVAPVVTTIDLGGATSGNNMFAQGQPMVTDGVFGYYQSDYGLIELRTSKRIPTKYAWMGKSYGSKDVRNPLALRVHPVQGFGMFVVPSNSDETSYPITRMNIEFEFGVGVGADRTNGVAAYYDASGTWTNPTIS